MNQSSTQLRAARALLSEDRPTLIIIPPQGPSLRVRLSGSRFVVGRGAKCDLQIPAEFRAVSRRHLKFEVRGSEVRVRNLSSRGASIDGVEMGTSAHVIGPAQKVSFSGFELRLESSDAPQEFAPTCAGERVVARHSGLIGSSHEMQRLRRDLQSYAPYGHPVLVRGETGSGKELVARALHQGSTCATGPFVALNCAALPEGTAASLLFGHEKGAFTGASQARPGALRSAEGGTLFLDELAELPLPLQATLLRALETREVLPMGSDRRVPVNFRLVTATHRDLHSAVRDGRFRSDLYFRVAVLDLDLPPLRDRGDDVIELAEHFISIASPGRAVPLSRSALERLRSCPWPGNVRQLRNAVHRALVASAGGPIEEIHFGSIQEGQWLSSEESRDPGDFVCISPEGEARRGLREISAAIRRAGGNRSRAASALGIFHALCPLGTLPSPLRAQSSCELRRTSSCGADDLSVGSSWSGWGVDIISPRFVWAVLGVSVDITCHRRVRTLWSMCPCQESLACV